MKLKLHISSGNFVKTFNETETAFLRKDTSLFPQECSLLVMNYYWQDFQRNTYYTFYDSVIQPFSKWTITPTLRAFLGTAQGSEEIRDVKAIYKNSNLNHLVMETLCQYFKLKFYTLKSSYKKLLSCS